jgi:hypothetical protein
MSECPVCGSSFFHAWNCTLGQPGSIFGEKRSVEAARILVNAKPTEAMKMAGVNAIIDAGLDGPDGVGMEDAAAVWHAMTNAVLSQSPEMGMETGG